jgi:fatty-acyl-CoA synthase
VGLHSDRAIWTGESEGIDLVNLTIGDLVDQQAETFPDREALVYNYPEAGIETRLTHRQYRDEVNRLAKGLIAVGVAQGDHVAIWASNLPEWAFLQMAAAKVGAVLVTINTTYRASELEYVLRQGDVAALFLIPQHRDNNFLDAIYQIAPELRDLGDPSTEVLQSAKLPCAQARHPDGRGYAAGALALCEVDRAWRDCHG